MSPNILNSAASGVVGTAVLRVRLGCTSRDLRGVLLNAVSL